MTELTPTERLHLAVMLTLTFTTGINAVGYIKNGRRLRRHPAWSRAPWSEDCAISARSGHVDPRRSAPR